MAARKRRSPSKSLPKPSLSSGIKSAFHGLTSSRNTLDAQELIAHLNASSLQETIGRSNPIAIHGLIPEASSVIESITRPSAPVGPDLAESLIAPVVSEETSHFEMPTSPAANIPADTGIAAKGAAPEVKRLRRRRLYVRARLPGLKTEISSLINEKIAIKTAHSNSAKNPSDEMSMANRRQYIACRLATLRDERKILSAESKEFAAKLKTADAVPAMGEAGL